MTILCFVFLTATTWVYEDLCVSMHAYVLYVRVCMWVYVHWYVFLAVGLECIFICILSVTCVGYFNHTLRITVICRVYFSYFWLLSVCSV